MELWRFKYEVEKMALYPYYCKTSSDFIQVCRYADFWWTNTKPDSQLSREPI